MGAFKEPHGGVLIDLYLNESEAELDLKKAPEYPTWVLTERQLCDLDLMVDGAFSPLRGFMTSSEYKSVCENMRLPSGEIWPLPICLDVSEEFGEPLRTGQRLALTNADGLLLATMDVENVYRPDRQREAEQVYGTESTDHPGVDYLLNKSGPIYVGGRVRALEPQAHLDFKLMRDVPSELRGRFRKLGCRKVVAFHTRSPMNCAHQQLTFKAARDTQAHLLIQPTVGPTAPDDINHYSRVRCYQHVIDQFPAQTTSLSLLNLAMRLAGPREAILHAIVHKNYGCTHFIVGRDHASPGDDSNGKPFYGPYDAQKLFKEHEADIGVTMLPFKTMVYIDNKSEYAMEDEVQPEDRVTNITDSELRRRLREGEEIPEWFANPKVVEELRSSYPQRSNQGLTVLLTGLPSSGKSVLAKAVMAKLLEHGGRPVSLLDSADLRKMLSDDLTFTKEHREMSLKRISHVAREVTRNGGIALCAAIAPFEESRRTMRAEIEKIGAFIEVYVSTPLHACEQRDTKGLYQSAHAGQTASFTGVSDPYEAPKNAHLQVDMSEQMLDMAAQSVVSTLEEMGLVT